MKLGPLRLLVHISPGPPADWYGADDESTGESFRVLVRWNGSDADAAWQIAVRRLQLMKQVQGDSLLALLRLSLDHEHPHAVWPIPVGESLRDLIDRRDEWNDDSIMRLGLVVATALADSHRLGFVHGHVEPAHIYCDNGEIRLDFAPAAYLTESVVATMLSLPMEGDATPTSPSANDFSADIYQLGVILWRLRHGREVAGPIDQSFVGDSAEVTSLDQLIEMMLATDRDIRPSASVVKLTLAKLSGRAVSRQRHTPVVEYRDSTPPSAGKHIGRYRLVRKLGEGGLGVVFQATDTSNGQQVAIKILHRRYLDSPRIVTRFKKEARLLAEISSPYVCRLLEFNEDAGVHYLVLEYLEGESLGTLLERNPKIPERLALRIAADAARALAEAHAHGVIHRDIKPDNIMLVGAWATLSDDLAKNRPLVEADDSVRVKLCDFGMARQLEQSASLDVTIAGIALGTPLYMSPEQAEGDGGSEVTARSDIYSLGVTLFHMLTGRPPFQARTIPALIGMHATEAPPSPTDLNPELSSAAAQVVLKAIAKSPDARYASAADLLDEIERLLRGEPTSLVVHPSLPAYDARALVSYDWSWELNASPAELWPLVSDTERVNQAAGIPAVDYTLQKSESPDPELDERVDRFGSFRKAGLTNAWREYPYEWIEGKRMAVLRTYSEGVFLWFASIVELQPRAQGGTTLHHRVRLVPRNFFGRAVASLEVGFKGRRACDAIYRRIDAYLTHQLHQTPTADPFVSQAAGAVSDVRVRQRLVDRLVTRGVEFPIAETLVEYLLKAPQQEIARVRPIALAHRLGLDVDRVVDAFLIAAHEGIVELLWDILCPKCRIASSIQETMRSIESHGECKACNLDFELDFSNSVELVFRVHSSIRASETGVFCVGGPAHSPHVAAQVRVAAGERLELALELGEGHYRLHGPQLGYKIEFRVHPEARAIRADLSLSKGAGQVFPRTFKAGSQTILLDNDHLDEIVIRVERVAPRTDALTAARASSLPRFRELFPQEVLSGNQLVSIAHVALLTTAIADASGLYELGDVRAFGILHEHFRLLEDHIRKESGALIKTIREGLVAVFHDSAAAVRVSLDLQPLLERNPQTAELRLRVGVHAGPAMVATINGRLDYFGATVNVAMTLPNIAADGEIVISQPIAADSNVRTLLLARELAGEILPHSPVNLPLQRLVVRPEVADASSTQGPSTKLTQILPLN